MNKIIIGLAITLLLSITANYVLTTIKTIKEIKLLDVKFDIEAIQYQYIKNKSRDL